ncbi:GNAT family N-acetyltransferase [Inquilinus limosus]|uniref:GNAT family N-acetyltransferase n=1 Tax=Inquilinus limosus TaxID=171674 RepID=UPI003F135D0F
MPDTAVPSPVTLAEVEPDGLAPHLDDLAEVLHGCVLDGASVGFVLPFTVEAARDFWLGLEPAFRSGARRLVVARLDGRTVGTVQLVLGMPANGIHRAEIAKLLVHPAARRRGIARLLMLAAEDLARRHGRTLLLLDTRRGDNGEKLYESLGFRLFGIVPGHACSPAGVLEDTSYMLKQLVAGDV